MKQRLGLLAVVLLVVANVFLIPLAFKHVQGPGEDAGARSSSGVDAPEPSADTDPEDETAEQPDDSAPLLMTSGGNLIVSSTRTSCEDGGDAGLRISTDRGKSFRTVEPGPAVTAVLALEVTGDKRVQVLAADKACRTVGYESGVSGRSWRSLNPEGLWHLDSFMQVRRVRSPNGPVKTPCVPKAMSSVRNDIVRVLCPDGRILRSPDDRSWTVVGRLKGAAAIRFPLPDIGFALAPRGSCAAAVMRTIDAGATWKRLACLEGEPPRGISGQDGQYAAVVGDRVMVSDDRAVTWQNP